ncbi:MAG: type II secretion system protein, partial [Candidatus Acidiferrales bacterium]
MAKLPTTSPRRSRESGFAFLLALMAIVVLVALTTTLLEIGATQNRRAREEETIWRGNQYVRAIRLYYHKTGRYP